MESCIKAGLLGMCGLLELQCRKKKNGCVFLFLLFGRLCWPSPSSDGSALTRFRTRFPSNDSFIQEPEVVFEADAHHWSHAPGKPASVAADGATGLVLVAYGDGVVALLSRCVFGCRR